MPMYNLLEYNKNYSKTTDVCGIITKMSLIILLLTTIIKNSASFKYKTSITEKTSNANEENGGNTEHGNTKIKKNLDIVVPLKHLSNFWKTLDIPLVNCEVSLILAWSENCVLTDIRTQITRETRLAINAPTNATFKITNTKLYVPVVTLSTENDKTLLEQFRTGFKRTIK